MRVRIRSNNRRRTEPIPSRASGVLASWGAEPAAPVRVEFHIKSMLRWDSVELLVRSIRRFYPTAPIRIADDSWNVVPSPLPEAMRRVIETRSVVWHQLPYDVGLPCSRQFMADVSPAEYVVQLDDDFVFTRETDVEAMLGLLDAHRWIDVAAGLVRFDGVHVQQWNGIFDRSGDSIKVRPVDTPWQRNGDVWFRRVDLSWNFFAARRQRLVEFPRDPAIKICGEHLDQYLCFQRDGIVCVETPQAIVGHVENRPPEYQAKRRRRSFYYRAMDKWEMTEPLNHRASDVPGHRALDVMAEVQRQFRERPNVVLLSVGHTGSSVVAAMMGRLGWHLGDADSEYAESVSIRGCNSRRDWGDAAEVLAAIPQPWVVKDPRFCESLDRWDWTPFNPVLVWLDRDAADVEASWIRRGESLSLLARRQTAAERAWERWTGPRMRLDYEQVRAAADLFRPS